MHRRRVRPGFTLIALSMGLTACGGGSPTVAQSLPPVVTVSLSPSLSPSPTVDPTTLPRLDGRYIVVKKVTSVRNFSGIAAGDILHRTYQVRPSCPIGPCGGSVRINLAESRTSIQRTLSYDETTHVYGLVPIISPVICTGRDGKRYKLKNTTDTVVITPGKTMPTGVDVIATTWTGTEVLKAVPDGPALNRGRCLTTVIDYRYTATLA